MRALVTSGVKSSVSCHRCGSDTFTLGRPFLRGSSVVVGAPAATFWCTEEDEESVEEDEELAEDEVRFFFFAHGRNYVGDGQLCQMAAATDKWKFEGCQRLPDGAFVVRHGHHHIIWRNADFGKDRIDFLLISGSNSGRIQLHSP